MKLIGYHGTLRGNAQSIEENGFRVSRGDAQWLGDGVYFFETLENVSNGFEEARNWVLKVKKSSDVAVFRACIESENFIDLIGCEEHKKYFKKLRDVVYKLHKKACKNGEPFNELAIYRVLSERTKAKIDVIRALVNADKYTKYDYECHTVIHAQVQVCVTDASCIKVSEWIY